MVGIEPEPEPEPEESVFYLKTIVIDIIVIGKIGCSGRHQEELTVIRLLITMGYRTV